MRKSATTRAASATPEARPPERRRQADRTATTKAALADATIDLLVERGWQSVTAIEVCARAGVTRGAFHHHYESLPSLIADSLRRVYSEMHATHPTEIRTMVAIIDATWVHISAPRFKAVIEAWLAMANDPTLRVEIGPVVAEFATLVSPNRSTAPLTTAPRRDFFVTSREAMLGLALGRATNGGRPLAHEQRVIARMCREAASLDANAK